MAYRVPVILKGSYSGTRISSVEAQVGWCEESGVSESELVDGSVSRNETETWGIKSTPVKFCSQAVWR